MYIAIKSAQEFVEQKLLPESGSGLAPGLPANRKDINILEQVQNVQVPTALKFFLPGNEQYKSDINHWATSSSQNSVITVQPDTAQDVAELLKYLSANRLAFGVKGGGHTANPGFSSSPGILISMKQFDNVIYNPDTQTAVIGAGLVWDDVYKELNEKHNVNVVGARVSNIGVAGFILGGGYSWHTNQYGLAVDTVVALELVKTDGTIVNVTHASDPDLFFALKGGGNNFVRIFIGSSKNLLKGVIQGIVTNFTMKTFPQGRVWGGTVQLVANGFNTPEADKIKKLFFAVQTFVDTVKTSKATLLASLGNFPSSSRTTHILYLMAFYDGPTPEPNDIFDVFKAIAPEETKKFWKERDYLDLVKNAFPYELSTGYRVFHTVSLARYTPELLQVIWDENEYWASNPTYPAKDRALHTYSVEPLLPDILSHSEYPSAYPPARSIAYSPLPVTASWMDPKSDGAMQAFVKEATDRVRRAGIDLNVGIGPRYPNYAIFDTPLEELYGTNLKRLKEIKRKADPMDVMGLAGGFKL